MERRPKPEGVVNPQDLAIYFKGQNIVPLGRLFVALSRLQGHDPFSKSPVTHPGIIDAQDALGRSGVLILDAHPTRAGIIASGVQLVDNLNASRVSAPATIKHTEKGIGSIAIKMIDRVPGVEIIPVVRKKDKTKSLTDKDRKAINQEYIEKVLEALHTPGHIVVIAPFGVLYKNRKGMPIKGGVNGVLDIFTGPVFCTWSDRHWGKFTTLMSTRPLSLAGKSQREKTTLIADEFAALQARAGR